MEPKESAELLEAARNVIEQTRKLVLAHADRGVTRTVKEDSSWVTEADLAVEEQIREFLDKRFPDHGIIGEEFSEKNPDAELKWIIDPIDGTQNFAHGIPTYGTILGLQHKGDSVVGVVDHPALSKTYYASKGNGSFCDGQRLKIVDCENPPDPLEVVCLAPRTNFARSGDESLFDLIMRTHPSIRILYDIYPTSLTAQGSLAASIEYNVKLWDICCNSILVEEAGGVCRPLNNHTDSEGIDRYGTICGKPSMVEYLAKLFEGS